MPVTVEEKANSRERVLGDSAGLDLRYVIRGTDDDIEAKTALLSASPGGYDGLVRQNVHIEPVGPQLWDGTAHYIEPEQTPAPEPQTGDWALSFDTGGGTQHITQSLGTLARYAAPGQVAPDFGGAIGVTRDAVEGVDIKVPVYQFAETHYLPDSMVTLAYRGILFGLTGRTNLAGFRGTAAGECLFLGASGSKRGLGDWEITFRFAASPNVAGLVVGSITGIAKGGWDYLWVRYQDVEDPASSTIIKAPVAVYIEQVYRSGDFALLGIGN